MVVKVKQQIILNSFCRSKKCPCYSETYITDNYSPTAVFSMSNCTKLSKPHSMILEYPEDCRHLTDIKNYIYKWSKEHTWYKLTRDHNKNDIT